MRLDLNGKVDPSKSRYTILKSKLEVALHKAASLSWPKLMADEGQQEASSFPQIPVQQPSYPSSFKRWAFLRFSQIREDPNGSVREQLWSFLITASAFVS